jgi:hypothetical protein
MQIDPAERNWLERKSLEIARLKSCSASEALLAAREEFARLSRLPKAVVIPFRPRDEVRLTGASVPSRK